MKLKTCILLAFGIALQEAGGCPDKWITYNGMCYSFNTTKMNWFHAAHACKEQGAWLVDIHSKDEDSFLKSTINRFHAHEDPQNIGYWTSGNDLEVEGQWVWGYEAKSNVAYTDWFPGEPNNNWYDRREEDCVVLWGHDNHGYQWNDQPCDITDFFICKTEDSSAGVVG